MGMSYKVVVIAEVQIGLIGKGTNTDCCLTESSSMRVEQSWSSNFCMSLSWDNDSSRIRLSFSTLS